VTAQPQLIPDDSALLASLEDSRVESSEDYGAVFTRPWVVNLILDLCGYTSDQALASAVAIEPACGDGAFLGPMVRRLSDSIRRSGEQLCDAENSLVAYDLQPSNVQKSRSVVVAELVAEGWKQKEAKSIAEKWVRHNDFLLGPPEQGCADYVMGNPPYIRLEDVSKSRGIAYRAACPTMSGRADIYVGFFEVGLRTLRRGGKLGFICADRWMRNQYGRNLRAMVSSGYAVDSIVQMHEVDAFEEAVSAYPAITILRRGSQGKALVSRTDSTFGEEGASQLVSIHTGKSRRTSIAGGTATTLQGWFEGEAAWPEASPARIELLRKLESTLRPLEDETTETRVGIGVATGADRVFITKDEGAAEPERMLPLLLARDVADGTASWSGSFLVNPWADDDSGLVDLEKWPRLAKYLEGHSSLVKARNCAKKAPNNWYRTIDRVRPDLTRKPKLVFPDIKASIHPVLDNGRYYPHHNLYWITSSGWDLEVLGGLLLSKVAQMFVEAYAVKMRGGYLRFQAQYLRMIRVPNPEEIQEPTAALLRAAFEKRDAEAATEAALAAYGIGSLPD
jgi:adenine-specific DNA-methyltransferase